jgi:ubiquitin
LLLEWKKKIWGTQKEIKKKSVPSELAVTPESRAGTCFIGF